MRAKFTDLAVQAFGPGTYMDERTPAFGIRVGKTRKTWIVVKGERRTKIRLGHYPDMSLQEARKRALVTLGSPLQEKVQIGFQEAVQSFLQLPRWRPHSLRVMTSSLHHFTWRKNLDKITHEDVAQALEAIEGRSARAHALKDIRTFFNWTVPRYLDRSPAEGFKMESQPSRDRVLSHDELKRVWIAAETMGYPFGTIVKLLILTGCRKNEIGSLTWNQITKDTITIPATVAKNGREHTIPISALANNLLLSVPKPSVNGRYVFLATSGKSEKYNGYAFHLKELQKISETSGWTIHDIRRTYATNLAALGTPIHITERLLNHVSGTQGGIVAVYQKYQYLDEQREAVDKYEQFIQKLVS